MAGWSNSGPLEALLSGTGWSNDGPAEPTPEGDGWTSVFQRSVSEMLLVKDFSIIVPVIPGGDLGTLKDFANSRLRSSIVSPQGMKVADLARIDVGEAVTEGARLADLAKIGLLIREGMALLDQANLTRVKTNPTRDSLFVLDSAKPRFKPSLYRDGIAVAEPGAGGFTPKAPVILSTSVTGDLLIPPAFRYIDGVALGSGGGGAGGNQVGADGKGGKAGSYATRTWDRGAGRNTWLVVSVFVGAVGVGGTRNNNGAGTAGAATTITVNGDVLSAAGGAGGTGTNALGGTDVPGKSPGNSVYNGETYTGGTGSGTAPGSGGNGGGGAWWPANATVGSNGAIGKGWARFWM